MSMISNSFRAIIIYLQSAELVARFQRVFGVVPIDKSVVHHRAQQQHERGHQRKITYDTNVLDECIDEIEKSHSDPNSLDHRIDHWFFYYFFQLGTALGNEIFYIIFFPTWIWNVDGAVARKVVILWAFFMYVGQATKDIVEIPRPRSPPVIHLEKRYIEEYGFPSTHAMFAVGIPLSLVLLSHQRYEFPLWIGILCSTFICLWVCFSRIYLGMHTFLDIVGGVVYTLLLIFVMFPYVNEIDEFLLNFVYTPIVLFVVGIFLIKCYPSLKQWSTARSDTTVILGSTFGALTAANIMNRLGFFDRPSSPPLYSIISPDIGLCFVRTIIGMIITGGTREIVKRLVLRLTCQFYGLDWKNPQNKRLGKIEMPYYYLTYFTIGFNVAFTCPLVFLWIGINRDCSYTEL